MFTVYILQSLKDNKTYVGYTDNFERRFKEHNSGKSKSTKYRAPFKLLFKEEFTSLVDAKKREIYWKSGAGRRKMKEFFKMDNQTTDELAKILWDYNNLDQPVRRSDAILVLGSNDIRVAERGAELFFQGFAPYIIFAGNAGRLTKDVFDRPEADIFADVAIKMGVPKDKIIIEDKSTNTGENIVFTRKLLEEKGFDFKSFIVVHKPYMGRRAFATFKKQWPNVDVIMTSPQIKFEDYPNELLSKNHIINIMVGDIQRIKLYPEKGFQIKQEIPEKVWSAFEELVNRGFTEQLIKFV